MYVRRFSVFDGKFPDAFSSLGWRAYFWPVAWLTGSLPMPIKWMSWRLEDSTACGLSGCNTFNQNMSELLRENGIRSPLSEDKGTFAFAEISIQIFTLRRHDNECISEKLVSFQSQLYSLLTV